MNNYNLFKWFINLNPEGKSIIALLLGLNIYFGYALYSTNQDYKKLMEQYSVLFKSYNDDTKDCANKIIKINAEWGIRSDHYRNTIDQENRQRIKDWEEKYEKVVQKLEESTNKIKRTEHIIDKINFKMK